MLYYRLLSGLLVLALGLLIGGCASVSGSVEADADFSKVSTMHVYMQDRDPNAEVLTVLRTDLRKRGYQVTIGLEHEAPAGVDCLVEARDKWFWDITMYLLEFEVHFMVPDSGKLMASGKSRRPSLVRQGPRYMVDEVLTKIFGEPPGGTEP